MDEETDRAVATAMEGVCEDPENISMEQSVDTDGNNYYIVTDDGSTDEGELLLVIMSNDATDGSSVAESGIVTLDSGDQVVDSIASNLDATGHVFVGDVETSPEILESIVYSNTSGISSDSQIFTGGVGATSYDSNQVAVSGISSIASSERQIILSGIPTSSGGTASRQIIVQKKPTAVSDGTSFGATTFAGGSSQISETLENVTSVKEKGAYTVHTTADGKYKVYPSTGLSHKTLGYTTITKPVRETSSTATITNKSVSIDNLKSLMPTPKSSTSKLEEKLNQGTQTVSMVAKQTNVSIDKDRAKMAETADVLVELASSNPMHKDAKEVHSLSTVGDKMSDIGNRPSDPGDRGDGSHGDIDGVIAQSEDGPPAKKPYKDLTREEEIEVILHEIENMCNKLVDYEEEFVMISINKTLRSKFLSSTTGKEFLENNPDIVQRFLQFSFGRITGKPTKVKAETKRAKTPETPVRKSTRKRSVNPRFDSEDFVVDSTISKKKASSIDEDEDDFDDILDKEISKETEIQEIAKSKDLVSGPSKVFYSKAQFSKTQLNLDDEDDSDDNSEDFEIQQKKGKFQCSVCNESFANASNLKRHRQKHLYGNAFPCSQCNKRFSRKDILEVHMKTHARELKEDILDNNDSSLTVESDSYNDTSITVEDYLPVDDNDLSIKVEDTSVDDSEDKFDSERDNGTRVLRKRNKTVVQDDDDDDDDFEAVVQATSLHGRKLRRSWKNVKAEETVMFKCSVCGTGFKNLFQLKKHYKNHASCTQCGKIFLSQKSVRAHVRKVHGKKKEKETDISEAKMENADNIQDTSSGEENQTKKAVGEKTKSKKDKLSDQKMGKDADNTEKNSTDIEKEERKEGKAEEIAAVMEGNEKTGSAEDRDDGMESDENETNVEDEHKGDSVDENVEDNEEETNLVDEDDENGLTVKFEDIENRKFPCSKCNLVFTTSQNLRRHYKIHLNEFEFKCDYCGKEFVRSDLYKSHVLVNHGRSSGAGNRPFYPFKCSICGAKYTTRSVLNTHIRSKHTENKTTYKCDVCSKQFMQKSHLIRHQVTHSNKRNLFKCQYCGKNFKQKRTLGFHRCSSQGIPPVPEKSSGQFQCNKCDRSFDDIRKLNIHYRIHLDGRDQKRPDALYCQECKRVYTSMSNLVKHLKFVHSDERNFVCRVCDKSFKTKDALDRHGEVHKEPDGSLSCEICQKVLKTKESLNVHMKIHTGVKPFICDVCGTSFLQKGNLQKHMLIHSENYDHTCELCGKKFRAPETYKAHMRAHAIREGQPVDVRKYGKFYECEYCHKKMATSSRYKIHLRLHTNEKPYSCKYCNLAFNDPSKLRRHEKNHEKVSKEEETIQEIYVQHIPSTNEGEDITQIINLQDLPFLQSSGVQEVTVQTAETTEAPTLTIYIDQDGVVNNVYES